MNLQELGQKIDIDIAGSLVRFSNFEPMYLKYLKRFVTESTYETLLSAVEQKDYKGIEVSAHTLKGIAGNLGLTTLFNDFDNIVKAIRSEDFDKALSLCEEVKPKVQTTREAIALLD